MAILSADIRTVILLLWMGNLIAVALLAVYRHSPDQRYPHALFLGARLAQTLGWALLWLRDLIPNVLSAWLGNTLLFAGWALEALALLSLRQRRQFFDYIYLTAAALSLPVNIAVYALSSSNLKTAIASAVPLVLFILPALRLTLEKNASALRRVVGGLYLVFAGATSYRSVVALMSTTTFSLMSPGAAQSLDFLALFWLMLFGSVGYLLLLNEQAGQELLKSEEKYRLLNASLAQAVAARTEELQTSISHLEDEIGERLRVETELHQTQASLAQRIADQSRKLATLYDMIPIQGQVEDLTTLLTDGLIHIVRGTESDAACLYQRASGATELLCYCGLTPDLITQGLNTLPLNWPDTVDRPRLCLNLERDENAPEAWRHLGAQTSLSIPFRLNQTPSSGLLTLFWRAPRQLSVEDIALANTLADLLGAIAENARLRQQSQNQAMLKERRRLATDLHDSVNQSLYSLVLSARTATKRLKLDQRELLATSLKQISEAAGLALKEMRLLLYEMRLTPVEQIPLIEALETRLETVERRAGLEAHMIVETASLWPARWEKELYPIAMEALNNALKHSHASQVTVRLGGSPEQIRLEIIDDGQGFDLQQPNLGGLGLHTLAERAARLGGCLTIETAPGAGTRVVVAVGGAPHAKSDTHGCAQGAFDG